MDPDKQNQILETAVRLLSERCLRLVRRCYWAGTSSISLEELHHRQSFDLDFHTSRALEDVRPILTEMQRVFPQAFEMIDVPDEFGSGFRGVLALPGGDRITVEVLSNYEDVPETDLVTSSIAPKFRRISVGRYLADKIQCVAERVEARDLFDVISVLKKYPEAAGTAKRLLADQDELLLAERLLAWSDEAISEDLRAYEDVPAQESMEARDLLLDWLKVPKPTDGREVT